MQHTVSGRAMSGPTSISEIRWDVMQKLIILLDPSAPSGNDWKALADWLGFKYNFIRFLDSRNERTQTLIQDIYPARYTDASVEEIICALDELKRYDARDVLLRHFPGIDLEKLLQNGPPRKTRNFKSDDDGQLDTAQQHREECFSGCGDSLADDDSEMRSPNEPVKTSDQTYRREPTDCGMTGVPLENDNGDLLLHHQVLGHSGILANNHMPQTVNGVNYPQCTSPLGSIPVSQNYTFQNGWGQYSPPGQRANGHNSQLATDQANLQYGFYSGNFNPTASNGGHCHSCVSTPVCNQMSHPLHMHEPTSDHKNQMQSLAGQTFMSLQSNLNEDTIAMDCENSCSPLDLSSPGHSHQMAQGHNHQMASPQGYNHQMASPQGHSHQMASPQGHQMFVSCGQPHPMVTSQSQMAGQVNHGSGHQQFSLTSTGCSDVRIGGNPIQIHPYNGNGCSPLNISQLCVTNEFQISTSSKRQQNGSAPDNRTPKKTNSWPGSQRPDSLIRVRPRSGDSASAVLITAEYERAPRTRIFVTYTRDSNSIVNRAIDLAECLKKNGFQVSVDMFENNLVNTPQLEADWHDKRYNTAEIMVVVISKHYRDTIENDHHAETITQGSTHAKHIYNRMLQDGKKSNKRIVLLRFPHTEDTHIPPPLKEIASAIFPWPKGWENVLYYLTCPQQIMHKPNVSFLSSNSSNSTDSNKSYTIKQESNTPPVNYMTQRRPIQPTVQVAKSVGHAFKRDRSPQGNTKLSLEEAVAMQPLPHRPGRLRTTLEARISRGNPRGASHPSSNCTPLIAEKMC